MADPKRYLISGGTDDDGYPIPSFVVEVPGSKKELSVELRESAQEDFKNGKSKEEVAKRMGGKVVTE